MLKYPLTLCYHLNHNLLSLPINSNFLMRKMATLAKCSLSPKHICQLSKPTIAIIVINLIVSTAFATIMNILDTFLMVSL